MAMTINKPDRETSEGITENRWRWFDVIAAEIIYLGAAVFRDAAGNATAVPVDATTICIGIAGDNYDNSAGAITTDTPLRVEHGQTERLIVSGLAVTSIGAKVYATADDVFDLVVTTNLVGTVDKIIDQASGDCMVLVAPGLF